MLEIQTRCQWKNFILADIKKKYFAAVIYGQKSLLCSLKRFPHKFTTVRHSSASPFLGMQNRNKLEVLINFQLFKCETKTGILPLLFLQSLPNILVVPLYVYFVFVLVGLVTKNYYGYWQEMVSFVSILPAGSCACLLGKKTETNVVHPFERHVFLIFHFEKKCFLFQGQKRYWKWGEN